MVPIDAVGYIQSGFKWTYCLGFTATVSQLQWWEDIHPFICWATNITCKCVGDEHIIMNAFVNKRRIGQVPAAESPLEDQTEWFGTSIGSIDWAANCFYLSTITSKKSNCRGRTLAWPFKLFTLSGSTTFPTCSLLWISDSRIKLKFKKIELNFESVARHGWWTPGMVQSPAWLVGKPHVHNSARARKRPMYNYSLSKPQNQS
jgi:hypothetical protein